MLIDRRAKRTELLEVTESKVAGARELGVVD
jgi:hypothetical protein